MSAISAISIAFAVSYFAVSFGFFVATDLYNEEAKSRNNDDVLTIRSRVVISLFWPYHVIKYLIYGGGC